jgi:UDP-glucose 4-epimerase
MVAHETGRTAVPVPEPFLKGLLGRFGFPDLPPGALEHIKYPIVVDGRAFREATGFTHVTGEVDLLHRYRRIAPV